MSMEVRTYDELCAYVDGIVARTQHFQHHAGEVKGAFHAVLSAIWFRHRPDHTYVQTYKGQMVTAVWVDYGGLHYAIIYNYETRQIEFHEGTRRGRVIAAIDDTTSVGAIENAVHEMSNPSAVIQAA